jgi:tetratricopeptide (TPR) repeat protein
VERLTATSVLLRILIPVLLIPVLGITPLPHSVYSSLRQVQITLDIHSPRDTSANFSQLIKYFPQRLERWELTGHYALLGGEFETAIVYFQQAAELNRLSSKGFIELGDAALLAGDLATAISSWKSAVTTAGPSIYIYSRLLEAHRLQDEFNEMIADLQILIELDPNNSDHLNELGLLLATTDPEIALAYLIRAAELNPVYTDNFQIIKSAVNNSRNYDNPAFTLVESGRALANLNYWQHAARAFLEATIIRPDYAEAWAFLGEARQQISSEKTQFNSDIGYKELVHALELNPDSIAANTLMALYWQRQGRNDLTLVYLHQAESIEPNNPTIQVEIGRTIAMMGDLEKAQEYYERATQLAPNDPNYWRLLAEFSLIYETQLQEVGLPAARQAVLLNPESPANLDMMGQIFILLEDFHSAIRFLQRALQADPDYAAAHLHYGFSNLLQENTSEAWQHLSLAASLAPNGSSIEEQANRMLEMYFP